jgi:tRNA(Ile)-lysidine synthase
MKLEPTPHQLAAAMQAFTPSLPLAVALSGGADSSALLIACAQKWPGQVRAIHIHHGLQNAADSFAQQCINLCGQFEVPLVIHKVNARHASGESPEDAARVARYAAFTDVCSANWSSQPVTDIAIAQHADDQVETLILALSRGAGLPGLSAMPAQWQRGAITYHRPLLSVPGAQLKAWLKACGQVWVEDPSNSDENFTRNRIRARLLPPLEAAFPQFRETLGRSARHCAQGQALLVELATQDLSEVGMPPVIKALQKLTALRQANALRHWLKQAHQAMPSEAQLLQLLSQILACTTRGHQIDLKIGSGHVRRDGAVLRFLPAPSTREKTAR